MPAQVPHDQEVGIEPHLVDDAQLIIEPFADLLAVGAVPITKSGSLLAQIAEIGLGCEPIRDREIGQMVVLEAQVYVAALGDEQCIAQGFRDFGKELAHLGRCAQVVRIVRHAHAVGFREQGLGLDGEQDILQAGIVLVDVMDIVGGDVFCRITRPHLDQLAVQVSDLFDVMLLKFHKEAVGAEDIVIPVHPADRFLRVIVQQCPRDLGGHASGCADDPFGVGCQKVMVDAGIIVKAIELGCGGNLEQVFVACLVFGEQKKMKGRAIEFGVAVGHPPRSHVRLYPNDRMNILFPGCIVKVDHAEHRAVVRDRHMLHTQLLHTLHQLLDIGEAV